MFNNNIVYLFKYFSFRFKKNINILYLLVSNLYETFLYYFREITHKTN